MLLFFMGRIPVPYRYPGQRQRVSVKVWEHSSGGFLIISLKKRERWKGRVEPPLGDCVVQMQWADAVELDCRVTPLRINNFLIRDYASAHCIRPRGVWGWPPKIEILFITKHNDKTKPPKPKMSYTSILNALDVLVEYPHLSEYIKTFDGHAGFMYTPETDPQRRAYAKQLDKVLDSDGSHSGGSWGFMLRGIQAVLMGTWTREYLVEQIAKQKRKIAEWEDAYQQRQQAYRLQAAAAAADAVGIE